MPLFVSLATASAFTTSPSMPLCWYMKERMNAESDCVVCLSARISLRHYNILTFL